MSKEQLDAFRVKVAAMSQEIDDIESGKRPDVDSFDQLEAVAGAVQQQSDVLDASAGLRGQVRDLFNHVTAYCARVEENVRAKQFKGEVRTLKDIAAEFIGTWDADVEARAVAQQTEAAHVEAVAVATARLAELTAKQVDVAAAERGADQV